MEAHYSENDRRRDTMERLLINGFILISQFYSEIILFYIEC